MKRFILPRSQLSNISFDSRPPRSRSLPPNYRFLHSHRYSFSLHHVDHSFPTFRFDYIFSRMIYIFLSQCVCVRSSESGLDDFSERETLPQLFFERVTRINSISRCILLIYMFSMYINKRENYLSQNCYSISKIQFNGKIICIANTTKRVIQFFRSWIQFRLSICNRDTIFRNFLLKLKLQLF